MFKLIILTLAVTGEQPIVLSALTHPYDFMQEEACHEYARYDWGLDAREGIKFDYRCIKEAEGI